VLISYLYVSDFFFIISVSFGFISSVMVLPYSRGNEQPRGERVSAGLLQHGKRVLEWLNDIQKGQG